MNDFQYHIHNSNFKSIKFPISERIFSIHSDLDFYKSKYDITRDLYNDSFRNEITEFKSEYKGLLKELKKVYDKEFESMEGSDEEKHSYADHISGLSLHEYEQRETIDFIKGQFYKFMDSYSKSMIITIQSLNEKYLIDLCNSLSDEFNKRIKYEHLDNSDFLNSIRRYFDLVLEILSPEIDRYISELVNYQKLRNKIVHTMSMFKKDDTTIVNHLRDRFSDSIVFLEKGEYFFLRINSANIVSELFLIAHSLFEEVMWEIDNKLNHDVLKSKLLYWLTMLDNNIKIENTDVTRLSKDSRQIICHFSSSSPSINDTICRLTIKHSKKGSFSITNQCDRDNMNQFTQITDKHSKSIFHRLLRSFYHNPNNLDIRILVYPA